MVVALLLAGFLCSVNGLPLDPDGQMATQITQVMEGANWPCMAKECHKPAKRYERILPTVPGVQWMDHGGYCGSWSIQRAAMAKGAWISQKQVRDHTKPGGGNDNEILATNIDDALQTLKLKAEGFDYKHLPMPQADAYRKWIKAKIVAGHAVVWMIMQPGEQYPVYPSLPKNSSQYGHIEPVVGILSDHPLDDDTLYDDDYVVHFTDANLHPYYRTMKSLPDNTQYTGNCRSSHYVGFPCIYDQLGFGWAIEGFLDSTEALPLSLLVQPSDREPDVRTGSQPQQLTGIVTVDGLTVGTKYAIYRWNSVESAFDYSTPHSVHRFTATGESEVYTDSETFSSDSAVYYRCIVDSATLAPRKYARGFIRQPRNANDVLPVATITDDMRQSAPQKIDWGEHGAITPVKNQGGCGSCWAYSATEGIESGLYMATKKLIPLSPQQIISCDKDEPDGGGCDGGDLPTAFAWVMKTGGMDTAADYPGTSASSGRTGKCTWSGKKVVKVTNWTYAIKPCALSEKAKGGQCTNQDEDGLKAALATFGPLSVCVNAGSWDGYSGGVFRGRCSGAWKSLDHCVQLVGYDTTASTPYWKVRNSWGSSWGEHGFIRLPMGENSCGIADEATYVKAAPIDETFTVV